MLTFSPSLKTTGRVLEAVISDMGFTILDTKGDANRTMASLLLVVNSPYYAVLSGDSDFLVYKNSRLISFELLKFSKGIVQVGQKAWDAV